MEKGISLNEKEVNGEDDVAMMFEDGGRYCDKLEVRDVGWSTSSGLPLKGSKIRAVDVHGSLGIVGSNRTTANEIG